jgi:hypothetical protein
MVQAADFADWHNVSQRRWLDRPPVRRLLGEGEVGASVVVIRKVASQDAAKVTLAQDDHVVEAVAPNRADQAFGERILPRTSSSREDLLDPHTLHALSEGVAVDGVLIAQEVGRGRVVGEGVHDLLSGPRCGGMLGGALALPD